MLEIISFSLIIAFSLILLFKANYSAILNLIMIFKAVPEAVPFNLVVFDSYILRLMFLLALL